jgi:hypothetical protein
MIHITTPRPAPRISSSGPPGQEDQRQSDWCRRRLCFITPSMPGTSGCGRLVGVALGSGTGGGETGVLPRCFYAKDRSIREYPAWFLSQTCSRSCTCSEQVTTRLAENSSSRVVDSIYFEAFRFLHWIDDSFLYGTSLACSKPERNSTGGLMAPMGSHPVSTLNLTQKPSQRVRQRRRGTHSGHLIAPCSPRSSSSLEPQPAVSLLHLSCAPCELPRALP